MTISTFIPYVSTGHVLVMKYDFQAHKFWERDYKFTVSPKGRLLFDHHPALFQGMKPERLGQYTLYKGYNRHGVYNHMAEVVLLMFDNPDFERQKNQFLRQIVKGLVHELHETEDYQCR